MANQLATLSISGLGTVSYTIPEAGYYFIEGHLSLPTLSSGSGVSSVLVTINQNGSPIYTGVAGAEGFYWDANFALADVIAIVLTSAVAGDNLLNVVKGTVQIGQGL